MANVQIPSTLMTRVAQGDHQAFRELYDLTSKPVFSFILSMTKDPDPVFSDVCID